MADYEKQERELEERIAQLRARQQQVRARAGEAERKGLDRARIVAGSLLVGLYPSWREIDFGALASVVSRNAGVLGSKRAEPLPGEEASRRLRRWEESIRKGAVPRGEREEAGHGGAD